MFFLFSKVLNFFALPSNIFLSLAVLGVLLTPTRYARLGRRLAAIGVLALLIAGLSPLGNALILPLEERFPRWDPARGAPYGIIVLGGGISGEVSAARDIPAINEAGDRLIAAAELARRYPEARIVFSGGDPSLGRNSPEAKYALAIFTGLGIDRGRISFEDISRTTAENAAASKALLNPKPGERWLLLTSSYHMPRAVGCFRKVGFPVEAYPVDWRTRGAIDAATPFEATSAGLSRTDNAMREWVGLIAYWLSGRTGAFFPAPESGN